jgi:hypothetical protein
MTRFHAVLLCAALLAGALDARAATADPATPAAGPRLAVDTELHVAPILLVSFSAVAIAVGAGFGWEADQLYDDWKKARAAGDPMNQMGKLADDVRGYSITANVLMIGGAAFAIVGTIWWIAAAKRGRSARAEQAVAWRPLLGPAQAGAVVEF